MKTGNYLVYLMGGIGCVLMGVEGVLGGAPNRSDLFWSAIGAVLIIVAGVKWYVRKKGE